MAPSCRARASGVEHGYDVAGPPREIYRDDPATVQPEDLRTRVEYPVRPGPHDLA